MKLKTLAKLLRQWLKYVPRIVIPFGLLKFKVKSFSSKAQMIVASFIDILQ